LFHLSNPNILMNIHAPLPTETRTGIPRDGGCFCVATHELTGPVRARPKVFTTVEIHAV